MTSTASTSARAWRSGGHPRSDRNRSVVRVVLDVEELTKLAGQCASIRCYLTKQVGGLSMVLATGPLTQRQAAGGVGCSDPGKDGRDAGGRAVVVVRRDKQCGVKEGARVRGADAGPAPVATLSSALRASVHPASLPVDRSKIPSSGCPCRCTAPRIHSASTGSRRQHGRPAPQRPSRRSGSMCEPVQAGVARRVPPAMGTSASSLDRRQLW